MRQEKNELFWTHVGYETRSCNALTHNFHAFTECVIDYRHVLKICLEQIKISSLKIREQFGFDVEEGKHFTFTTLAWGRDDP